MKVLILGGTGAMGVPLTNMLVNNNNDVVVTSRKCISTNTNQLRFVQGDAHEINFVTSLIKESKYDAVVDFMVYKRGELKERINIILGNTVQYIYLSSCRVFADSNIRITEESKRLKDCTIDKKFMESGEYAISKAEDEDSLRKSGYSNWTIIRPYITYFDNRLQLGVQEKEDWLYRVLNKKAIVFSRDIGDKYTTLTSGYDVADCIFKSIANENAFSRSYNCVTKETIKWKEVLNLYKKTLAEYGFDITVKWIDTYDKIGHQSYQLRYDRLYNRSFDNSRVVKELGKTSFISIEEGIRNAMHNFISNNSEFGYIYWERQGNFDRVTRERTNYKLINGTKNQLRYALGRFGLL